MKKKLQVFISSTYEDLIEERKNAISLVLREGHIPVCMELFGQDNRKQWDVIKNSIDESDIFIIMVKNRYGTIFGDNKSYTQMEYEYAKDINIPIIKVIFNDDINRAECDNFTKLFQFRNDLLKDNIVVPIKTEIDMAQRIIDMLNKFRNSNSGGWCRYDGYIKNCVEKYELLQFLMFAKDRDSNGFNRFDVAPKIMMLMDMNKDYNNVCIGQLSVLYTISESENSKNSFFDCKRKWEMRNIVNLNDEWSNDYRFYTTTDIGERKEADLSLKTFIDKEKIKLDLKARNNGISCWKWKVEPYNRGCNMINDMTIEETVKDAWNFNREHEVVYFIPRNFGEKINFISFHFQVPANMTSIGMELYEVIRENGNISRKFLGKLIKGQATDTIQNYEISIDNSDGKKIDMNNLYYIFIKL